MVSNKFKGVILDLDGVITTVAGNGTQGSTGDGGLATDASLDNPTGIAINELGEMFITGGSVTSSLNHVIRKIDVNGIITTISGNPLQRGFSGDGGPASEALLESPGDIAIGVGRCPP